MCDVCHEEIEPVLNANGETVWTQGHNPEPLCNNKLGYPLPDDARCCNACNADVLVARLRDLKGENNVKIKTPNRREFASGPVGYSSVEGSSGT